MKRLRYLLMREIALLFILVVRNVCCKKGSSAVRTHKTCFASLRLLREEQFIRERHLLSSFQQKC